MSTGESHSNSASDASSGVAKKLSSGGTLDTLSPLKTLARGFATVVKKDKLVSSVEQLQRGDDIEITLVDGKTQARIQ